MHRGAEQRSVVLVSEHPYTSILLPVSCTVGPALLQSFQDTAEKVFRDALHMWPAATPGLLTSVSIGPHRMVGRVPLDACLPKSETQLWQPVDGPSIPNPAWAAQCGVYGEVCIARTLQAHHKQLWSLWEVMLLGQPLMVFCSSPEWASSAVLALLALITPLPYEADYRPLLSIHDPQVQAVQVCSPISAPGELVLSAYPVCMLVTTHIEWNRLSAVIRLFSGEKSCCSTCNHRLSMSLCCRTGSATRSPALYPQCSVSPTHTS